MNFKEMLPVSVVNMRGKKVLAVKFGDLHRSLKIKQEQMAWAVDWVAEYNFKDGQHYTGDNELSRIEYWREAFITASAAQVIAMGYRKQAGIQPFDYLVDACYEIQGSAALKLKIDSGQLLEHILSHVPEHGNNIRNHLRMVATAGAGAEYAGLILARFGIRLVDERIYINPNAKPLNDMPWLNGESVREALLNLPSAAREKKAMRINGEACKPVSIRYSLINNNETESDAN